MTEGATSPFFGSILDMVTKDQIEQLAAAELAGTDLYVVEVTISPASDIELILDSDSRVNIDQCAKISRAIDTKLEESGEDDYSLVVASSGIGNPLKSERQYARCIGGEVEVLLSNGKKLTATLTKFENGTITITTPEKVAVEGKKRKEIVMTEQVIHLSEIKSVREALTIK